MKLQIIYLTICSLSQAAYISRMALINQNQPSVNLNANRIRPMTAFRPGVVMRPWNHPRLVPASSHRVPFVMYRNHPHRYSMKHYTPTRMATSPWKAATRQPATATAAPSAEYEFVKAVSSPPPTRTAQPNSGAIHTIPAPNLSLVDKPIVVLDDFTNFNSIGASTERPKAAYEVNENHPDPTKLNLAAKIEQPIGFSKSNTFTQADYQSLQNSAALQLASELGLSAISLPQHSIPQAVIHQKQQPQQVVTQQSIPQQHVQPQHFVQQQSIIPQQFTMHNFHTLPNAQEFMQAAPDGIVITPNALYQPDPAFLQKLQTQLLQRFPGVEFVPYAAGFELPQAQNQQSQIQQQIQNQILFPAPQNQQQTHAEQQTFQSQTQLAFKPSPFQFQTAQPQPQTQIHSATQPSHSQILFQPSVTLQPNTQSPFVLLQNEQYSRQSPPSFAVAESQNRYVVQRQTQEGTMTFIPQTQNTNVTGNHVEGNRVEVSTFSTPQNITFELVASESKPAETTVRYNMETTTEEQKTTPVHYTTVTQRASNDRQIGQNNGYMQAALVSQIAADILNKNSQISNQIYQNSVQINQKPVSTNHNTVQDNHTTAKFNQDNAQVNRNNAQANLNSAQANLNNAQANLNNAQANQNNAQANQNNAQANQNNAQANQNNAQAHQNNAQANQNNAQANQNNAQANRNNAQPNQNNAQPNQNNAQSNQNNAKINQNHAKANQNNEQANQNAQANQNNAQPNQNNALANQNIANIGNIQVAQSAGNVVTDGFYSAINDVRAGAALAQVDKPQESTVAQENFTTTTLSSASTINDDLKPYFVQKLEKHNQNQTNSEIKSVLGVPFAKAQNSVNVAYTLLRSDDKEAKVAKDGSVYAGQIVEASVSEDQDFNKQKANLLTRRAPIRLVAVADNKDTNITTTTRTPPRAAVIKARIPPKSKLTFDDKTGEPVLRIYASYVDTSAQKEAITAKLSNTKHVKEIAPRKPDSIDNWKVKALARPHGFEPNPNAVTQFGLKLRSRSDDYVPLFDDYED